MYQNMRLCMGPKAPESIHFCEMPQRVQEQEGDERIQLLVERMQRVIELARTIRERRNVQLKFPLAELVVVHTDEEFLADMEGELSQYVVEELNVRKLSTCKDPMKYASLRAEPNWQQLAKRLGKDTKAVASAIKELSQQDIVQFESSGSVEICGHTLSLSEINVKRDFKLPEGSDASEMDANGDGEVLAVLDLKVDTELIEAGIAREVVNRFQKLRKKAGLTVSDVVEFYYETSDDDSLSLLKKVLNSQGQYLQQTLGSTISLLSQREPNALIIAEEDTEVGSESMKCNFKAYLVKPVVQFNSSALVHACNQDQNLVEGVKIYIASRDMDNLKNEANQDGGYVTVKIMGTQVKLKVGEHIYWQNSN
eukprot:TRINITY_DN15369_c0_g1_i3.p1 TRINITY_DN15369_c0_g1~~TRINITY_DN15369_c0_g1_i3.p1  ORF type:complete len:396 (+),score=64.95 TRINITY_DN15369_c0_g1_i3:88-1188(+)